MIPFPELCMDVVLCMIIAVCALVLLDWLTVLRFLELHCSHTLLAFAWAGMLLFVAGCCPTLLKLEVPPVVVMMLHDWGGYLGGCSRACAVVVVACPCWWTRSALEKCLVVCAHVFLDWLALLRCQICWHCCL
jgi:hypothetical protein